MGSEPFAKVIKVINEYEVVINKGADDNIKDDNIFLVYNLGDELIDPDTNESLGRLELICGKAKVKHIQPKFTTLISSERGRPRKRTRTNPWLGVAGTTEEVTESGEMLEFENIAHENYVKKL